MSQTHIGERTWIDAQADRFEREWNSGADRPRIEDYLASQTGPERNHLLSELLRMERELRENAGEKPEVEEYRLRFPDDRAVVDAAFGIGDRVPRPKASPGPPLRTACSWASWPCKTTSSTARHSWPPSVREWLTSLGRSVRSCSIAAH